MVLSYEPDVHLEKLLKLYIKSMIIANKFTINSDLLCELFI